MEREIKTLDRNFCRVGLLILAQHDREYFAKEGLKVNNYQQRFLHANDLHQCIYCLGIKGRDEVVHRGNGRWFSSCKACTAEKQKERYDLNPEHYRELHRQYCERNRDIVNEKAKQYRLANPEKLKESKRKSYINNAEKNREYSRNYHRKNRDRILVEMSEYGKRNRARFRQRNATPEGRLMQLMRVHKRLALKKSKHTPYTKEDLNQRLDLFGDQCCYCKTHLKPEEKTVDHVYPLSRGGWDEVNNLLGCCISCNSSKHNRDWIKWYRSKPFYDAEREREIAFYVKDAKVDPIISISSTQEFSHSKPCRIPQKQPS